MYVYGYRILAIISDSGLIVVTMVTDRPKSTDVKSLYADYTFKCA